MAAGAEGPRTCFHSFRHCFRDALRNTQVKHDLGLALGGWAGAHEAEAAYGKGYSIAALANAVKAVSYESLTLAHLDSDLFCDGVQIASVGKEGG